MRCRAAALFPSPVFTLSCWPAMQMHAWMGVFLTDSWSQSVWARVTRAVRCGAQHSAMQCESSQAHQATCTAPTRSQMHKVT